MNHIVFFLVPGLHLLDLAGPAQVFSTAADSGYPYELSYVAERTTVPTAQGLPLTARLDPPELGPRDLIVVPGWRCRTLAASPAVGQDTLRLLRDHHDRGGTVAGVCAGADLLGRAGLLDGRRCTTHHDVQDELARRYPKATVVRDTLFTTDDRVVTSAGVASGIDLALHLLAGRHGPTAAAHVAQDMVVYARRNGGEPQASAMLRYRSHLDDTVHRAQDLLDARFDRPMPLPALATAVGVSERTLTRLFTRATGGLTPLRYQQALRLERAEYLIGHGTTVDAAARAVGFEDPRMLRRLRARDTR
ncbi:MULTISPECIES: GlxA family transcriptional regulator [Streptomyces]|uniref:AraC family transcriptional regulator n=1 Tax=Streptomyces tsukubensis (strain DSM 42081 / NBRC 108919 / NRRL 18488 / 9993) TaxID=1114943 RepID=I2NB93_STRT9|nr:DJ-1/PfpI family protein [Streptomyces tsukubensis]MYS66218.1 helix-turn-helix domain-containing protein [Streptomyces sp. SID5473]AZK98029.1 AraC family transcriptional regulator [Streptomyces tsukubensis]EIF94290.1 AraC family transcriptional regulator [Streptomyces tsukubensis NRRL18488]QKM66049.1 AraC family transcriptional regulator [Streptomyces tsukubensis NRRL18488]TAI42329.1 helix-turn-helix domain-containing protein [Streptomyces tsukubensis]